MWHAQGPALCIRVVARHNLRKEARASGARAGYFNPFFGFSPAFTRAAFLANAAGITPFLGAGRLDGTPNSITSSPSHNHCAMLEGLKPPRLLHNPAAPKPARAPHAAALAAFATTA